MKATTWVTAALAGILFAGCVVRKETDVSADQRYSFMVGKEYRTKGDFILFKFHKEDQVVQLDEPGVTHVPELKEMAGKKLPFGYDRNWVVGVLPAGSQFKVTRVMLVQGPPMTYIYYEAVITVGKGFEGWKIVPSWLGTNDFLPKFEPNLAEEVKPAVGK